MNYIETPPAHAMLGIRYLRQEIFPEDACPICSNECIAYLSVPSIGIGTPLTYLKCTKCRTVFLPKTARNENYYRQKSNETSGQNTVANFLKHYLEIGAGPDFMAKVLSKVLKKGVRTFCSVGCGAGLDLNIVATLTKNQVDIIGFEPNSYGEVQDLSVPIINDVLSDDWLETSGRKFDIVFASEVIEHIPDPEAFSKTMLMALSSDNAKFVLTTPNADLIAPENSAGDVYAALFPGEHKIIFSKESLEKTLACAGFCWIEVSDTKERLTAFAQKAIDPSENSEYKLESSEFYIRYLRNFVSMANPQSSSPLMAGNSFRLLSELVNAGKEREALEFLNNSKVLLDLCSREDDIPAIKESVMLMALSATDFDDHVRKTRGFLAPLSYYLAMLAFRLNRPEIAVKEFRKALQLLMNDKALSPFNFQVSCALINPCKAELVNSLVSCNKTLEAIEFIKKEPDLIISPVIFNAIVRSFINTSNSGDFAEATSCAKLIDENKFFLAKNSGYMKNGGATGLSQHVALTDPILLFDYHITRSYYELNFRANRMAAKTQMYLAARRFKELPSFNRAKILVKLAWVLCR